MQAVWIMDKCVKKGMNVLFICDRDILVSQTIDAVGDDDIDFGVIKAGYKEDRSASLQIASIQSLMNRELPDADMIIWDEAHERLSQQLWLAKKFPRSFFVGLTATPFRADGQSFTSIYQSLVVNTTPKELIQHGYLVPERVFAPAKINTSNVRVGATGDFVQDELAQAVSDMKIIGKAVDSWREFASGMLTMVFCVNVAHARKVARAFTEAGIPTEIVTGEVTDAERKRIIANYKAKKTLVLVNVEVYVKGANIPEIQCVIDLAPTLSLARYIQKIGRAGRPAPGKKSFLQLDHAGNSLRHGFWSQDREYSLDSGKSKRDGEYIASTKVCPSCFYVMLSTCTKCEVCDYVYPTSDTKLPDEIEGELEEVIKEQVKVRFDQRENIMHYESENLGSSNFPVEATKSFWHGNHAIDREKEHWNLYGKRITTNDAQEAIEFLLDRDTGSKKRQYLISLILEGKKKGYAPQWAFMRYKKRYKHYPKMR